MRLPNTAHDSERWRIDEIVPDFTLLDVWALPAKGGPGEFPDLLEVMNSIDPAGGDSVPAKALWKLRDELGKWFGLGRTSTSTDHTANDEVLPIPGAEELTLADRLPEDLQGTVSAEEFRPDSPFTPLYLTDDETAAEISNQTVHGVMHLAWAEQEDGRFQGLMSVYVKPRGRFGDGYMALIGPFRHWIVYPALMRQIEVAWDARVPTESGLKGTPRPRT
ncbi:MAG: DUF2867 domain-containing protein [Thermoleophilia bacterium]|nr:DUF2867 domain-containing protein [Thermoleophilia bacterium]